MPDIRFSFRTAAITIATFLVAGIVVVLAQPRPVESAVLGAGWQCNRTALVLTTCAQRTNRAPVETSGKPEFRLPRV